MWVCVEDDCEWIGAGRFHPLAEIKSPDIARWYVAGSLRGWERSIGTIGCDAALDWLRRASAGAVVKECIETWACCAGSGFANASADSGGVVEEVLDWIGANCEWIGNTGTENRIIDLIASA